MDTVLEESQSILEACSNTISKLKAPRLCLYGITGSGKSSLLSALLDPERLPLKISSGEFASQTQIPLEVGCQKNLGEDFELDVIPLSMKEWKSRRIKYAQEIHFFNKNKEKNLYESPTPPQEAIDVLTTVYGKTYLKELRKLRNRKFVELPHVKDILQAPCTYRFCKSEQGDLINALSQCLNRSGNQYWPLLRKVRLVGNFNIPENIVLVDLPGVADTDKGTKWTSVIQEELGYPTTHIWLVSIHDARIGTETLKILKEAIVSRGLIESSLAVLTRCDFEDVDYTSHKDQYYREFFEGR